MPPPIPGLLQPAAVGPAAGGLDANLLQMIHDKRPDLSPQDIQAILAEFATEQQQQAAPQAAPAAAAPGVSGGLDALRNLLSGQGGQAGYTSMGQPTGLNNAFPELMPRQPTVQIPGNGPGQGQFGQGLGGAPSFGPGQGSFNPGNPGGGQGGYQSPWSAFGDYGRNMTGKPGLSMQNMPNLNYQFPPIRF